MRRLATQDIPRHAASAPDAVPRHPVSALLEDIRSIHNVGSMFRTADATALERLYLTGITATPNNRAIRKTALGAEKTVPWLAHGHPTDLIIDLKARHYTIAALEITDSPTTISDLTGDHYPLLLVVGNEVHGVSDEVLELCDIALEIPQFGTKQSLNASVAFGVATYGIIGRYRALTGRPISNQTG